MALAILGVTVPVGYSNFKCRVFKLDDDGIGKVGKEKVRGSLRNVEFVPECYYHLHRL